MKLIASVLHLDRKAIKALRITDPYSLHRVVYSLYEDVRSAEAKKAGESSGILYADQGGDFSERRILLLADRMPACNVEGQYGQVQSKVIPDGFLDHAQYRFKVIVNPTRRDNARRKLVPLKDRATISQWFCERAARSWGFEVSAEHLQVDQVNVLQFQDKQQNSVTLAQAHLQGQFRVTNREQFIHSFAHGVGRGRSFGCGLLQIAPLLDTPFA